MAASALLWVFVAIAPPAGACGDPTEGPTILTAHAALVSVTGGVTTVHAPPLLSATLTTGNGSPVGPGTPLDGFTIKFSVGGHVVCSAVTGASDTTAPTGLASCTDPAIAQLAINRGYFAIFAGLSNECATFGPSQSHGALVSINGRDV